MLPFLSFAPTAEAHTQFTLKIKAAIIKYKVSGIVIGWPLDQFGGESKECRQVSMLIDRLRSAHIFAPILLWDERGTSALAKANIRAALGNGPRDLGKAVRIGLSVEQRSRVDEEAATVLLQSFLNAAVQELPRARKIPMPRL